MKPMKEQRHFPKKSRNPERDFKIRALWSAHSATLNELAKVNNLTKVRIHQIIHGRAVNRAVNATEEWYEGS